MCCQIVARKYVAPSSGDFRRRPAPSYACGQDQEFWRKKSFSKIIITPLPRPRPDFRKCVTSMIFQGLLVFSAWRAWRGGPQLKISLRFFGFQQKKSKTSWWLVIYRKKVLSSQHVLLWIFLEIGYLIWRYAELKRLLVGSSIIRLNIEFEQDNRTVCCNHKIVSCGYLLMRQFVAILRMISQLQSFTNFNLFFCIL